MTFKYSTITQATLSVIGAASMVSCVAPPPPGYQYQLVPVQPQRAPAYSQSHAAAQPQHPQAGRISADQVAHMNHAQARYFFYGAQPTQTGQFVFPNYSDTTIRNQAQKFASNEPTLDGLQKIINKLYDTPATCAEEARRQQILKNELGGVRNLRADPHGGSSHSSKTNTHHSKTSHSSHNKYTVPPAGSGLYAPSSSLRPRTNVQHPQGQRAVPSRSIGDIPLN